MLLRAVAGCLVATLCLAQDASFRADVHLVSVGFTVRDSAGRLVPNLSREAFEVSEDGAPQKIAFFTHSADVPLDLGLVVDFSGSQADFIKAHHKDLDTFLKKALSPRDRAFLVCFGNHIRLAQDFTDEPKDIVDALHRFEKGSFDLFEFAPHEHRVLGTAFYDAIFYSIGERLAASDSSRKAMIVFSDGEDNSSGHHMLEAIEAAQTNDVLLFPVRYTEKLKGGPIARNRYGETVMARIAKETGGSDFNARANDLAVSFEEIGEELHSSYRLAYHSTNSENDDTFRKVRIRVRQPGYTVRAKTGYYSK